MEMLAVVTIFAITGAGMYASLDRGVSYSKQAQASLIANDAQHDAFPALSNLIKEASIRHLDTTMRVYQASATSGTISSDRFTLRGSNLKQCPSPVCGFHTRPNLDIVRPNYLCGHEYRAGLGVVASVRGKVFTGDLGYCAFDGSTLVPDAVFDGLKLFTSRDPSGTYTTAGGASPSWTGLVLAFPFRDSRDGCQLRKYEIHVEDFLAGLLSYSSGWTRWDCSISGPTERKIPLPTGRSQSPLPPPTRSSRSSISSRAAGPR
jgi:hypothetical protein